MFLVTGHGIVLSVFELIMYPSSTKLKARALKPSTNTIHARNKKAENRQILPQKNSINVPKETLKKKTQTSKVTSQPKIDENDVSHFVKNSYNPLLDICALDDDLYQKVLKLELADDGIPKFESSEPFDF